MADGDGMSAPATGNGRLLLGLQGTLSEWARHLMQARLTAGLLHKAERGALALPRPTGLVRHSQGTVHQMPNQAAHARLALVFETFLPCRSASNVVAVFKAHDLLRPRRDRFGGSGGEGAAGGRYALASQVPGLCRGVHLWPYPHPPTRGAPGTPRDHPAAPGAVAHRPPGRLPTLHQLGHISPDADHAHSQARRV